MAFVAGSIELEILPSLRVFGERLRAGLQPIIDKVGRDVGQTLGDHIADQMPAAGEEAGSRFAEAFKLRTDAIRDVHIGVDVDEGAATAKLAAIGAEADAVSGESGGRGFIGLANSIGQAAEGFPALITAGLAIGPALIPIVAVLGAGIAAIASPLVAAAAGFGAFAAIAIPAVQGALKGQQALTKAQQQYAKATTDKGRAAALLAEKKAQDGLTGSQLTFLSVLKQVRDTFSAVSKAAGPSVLAVVSDGLKLAIPLIKAITPILGGVTIALDDIVTQFGKAFAGPGFTKFVDFLSGEAPIAIDDLGSIALAFGKIGANVLEAFAPLGNHVLDTITGGLQHLADSSDHFAQSKGFQSFIAFVVQAAPVVGKFFESLLKAIIGIAVEAAPFGVLVLKVLTPILNFVGKHPDAAFWALGAAITAAAVALILLTDSNPIGLLITGIVLLAIAVVKNWTAIKNAFLEGFHAIVNFGRQYGPLVFAWFTAGLSLLVPFVISHFGQIESTIVNAFADAYGAVKSWVGNIVGFVEGMPGKILDAIGDLSTSLSGKASDGFNGFLSGVETTFGSVLSFIEGIPDAIVNALGNLAGMLLQLGENAGNQFVSGLKSAAGGFFSSIGNTLNPLNAIPHAMGGVAAAGQLALVGENGPELILPAQPMQVIPNRQTMALLAQHAPASQSGQPTIGRQINLGGVTVNDGVDMKTMLNTIDFYSRAAI